MNYDEEAIAFDNMTLDELEQLVGRKPDAVEVREKWVVATYGKKGSIGGQGFGTQGADVRIHFRKW